MWIGVGISLYMVIFLMINTYIVKLMEGKFSCVWMLWPLIAAVIFIGVFLMMFGKFIDWIVKELEHIAGLDE